MIHEFTEYAPMRGRVFVEVLSPHDKSPIILPDVDPRKLKIHRGRVIAIGPPARDKWGNEIAPGFAAGDVVLYVYALALEKVRKFGDVACVAQEEVQGVIE